MTVDGAVEWPLDPLPGNGRCGGELVIVDGAVGVALDSLHLTHCRVTVRAADGAVDSLSGHSVMQWAG